MRFKVIDNKTTNAFKDVSKRWIVFDVENNEWCVARSTKREAQDTCNEWNREEVLVKQEALEDAKHMEIPLDSDLVIIRIGHLTLLKGGLAA